MQPSNKLFNILLYALMGISALLSIVFFFNVAGAGDNVQESDVSTILYWCFALIGIAVAVSIIFPVLVMAKNPKKAKTALFGIVGLLVIFGIGYGLAGSETYEVGDQLIGEAVSKRSGAGLVTFYILIIGAIGAIIYSEVSKAFK